MKFKEYYIINEQDNSSNCVVRSLCKILNKNYNEVFDELNKIASKNNLHYNDIDVFEKYMYKNKIFKINCDNSKKVSQINLKEGSYIILCWDKDSFYHMIPIIDNNVYDKDQNCLNLYVIFIYKKDA